MGGWEENLLFCIYCPPVWTNVSNVYIYKSYEMFCKTLDISAIRIACFLDDGLGVASSYKMALFHSNFVEKIFTKRRFYHKRRKVCLETIAKFNLVRNKNKLKKRLLLYTNRKTVSYKKLDCILIEKLPYTTARE